MIPDLDIISVAIGYIGGVFLTWSICRSIYDSDIESSDLESGADVGRYGIYGWDSSSRKE